MSEKDKNTIIIAAVALLIFGLCFLGIKPAFTNLKEAKAQNAELSATKQEMQTEINSLPTYKTGLENAKVEYAKTTARAFGDLTNDKIHDEVVAMAKNNGLEVTNFTVSDVTTGTINSYSVSEGLGVGGVGEGTVKLANVSLIVSGSKDNIVKLADYMNKAEGIYVSSLSFGSDGTDGSTAANIQIEMLLANTID